MKLSIAIASMLANGHLARALEDAAGVTPIAKKDAALPFLRALTASGPRSLQVTDQVRVVDTTNGNRCFDYNQADQDNIYANTCDAANVNQLFDYDEATQSIKLRDIQADYCLDYNNAPGDPRYKNVYMFNSCTDSANQRWVYDPSSKVVKTLEDNLCLDMATGGGTAGTNQDFNLYMFDCTGGVNQKFDLPSDWKIVSPQDRITQEGTGLAMEIDPNNSNNAIAATARNADTDADYHRQVLQFVPATREIKLARDGLCLDYDPGNDNVYYLACNSQPNQKWVYDSTTKKMNTLADDKCLEIDGANDLKMAACVADQANQKFNVPATWDIESSNWDIIYTSVTSDFSSTSTDELVLTYDIGKGQAYTAELFDGDCTTAISGSALSSSTPTTTPKNGAYDTLTVRHDINKANIPNSNIWDAVNTQVEVCQVVKLFVENGADDLIIAEDKRVITIDMTLSSDYSISGAPLTAAPAAATVSNSGSVSGYLNAYQCDGAAFNPITANPLSPSEELVVCIKSTSTDVTIDNLESMTVDQTGNPSFAVIATDTIAFPGITSREYVPSANGVVVSTLLPSNKVTYANGATVDITGTVNLQFAGRRLRADVRTLLDSDDTAAFELQVDLKEMPIDEDHASSAVATKGALGAAFAFVSAAMLW